MYILEVFYYQINVIMITTLYKVMLSLGYSALLYLYSLIIKLFPCLQASAGGLAIRISLSSPSTRVVVPHVIL